MDSIFQGSVNNDPERSVDDTQRVHGNTGNNILLREDYINTKYSKSSHLVSRKDEEWQVAKMSKMMFQHNQRNGDPALSKYSSKENLLPQKHFIFSNNSVTSIRIPQQLNHDESNLQSSKEVNSGLLPQRQPLKLSCNKGEEELTYTYKDEVTQSPKNQKQSASDLPKMFSSLVPLTTKPFFFTLG